jgi:hypothetical protein
MEDGHISRSLLRFQGPLRLAGSVQLPNPQTAESAVIPALTIRYLQCFTGSPLSCDLARMHDIRFLVALLTTGARNGAMVRVTFLQSLLGDQDHLQSTTGSFEANYILSRRYQEHFRCRAKSGA